MADTPPQPVRFNQPPCLVRAIHNPNHIDYGALQPLCLNNAFANVGADVGANVGAADAGAGAVIGAGAGAVVPIFRK